MINYIAILQQENEQTVHSFWQANDDLAIAICEANHQDFVTCTLQTVDGRFVKEIA